jgi:beta-glucosidase
VNDVLRGEWGFDGFVVSDWASIYEMVNHGYAEDNKHAGELAINAGVDMDMMSYAYISHIEELLNEGKVSMETIDNAVRNILRIKIRLGLFENPYVDETKTESMFYLPESLEAARKSAVESAVLLTNNGVLPVDKTKVQTVLVTGPMADAPHDQLGTWTFDGDAAHTVTPLKAIKELYGKDVQVIYEPGLTFTREFDKGGIAKAVKAAKKADVILAFMGEEAIMSGEAHCLTDITLKGDQRAMIAALKATGKPLVLNIMAGRPLELDFEIANSDAILYSFHPGTMGGPAIAQLIFGDETPSGKTPITFPKNVGQIPIYYNHNMTGRPYNGSETMLYDIPLRAGQTSLGNTSYWLDSTFEPEFPFGYGLTYTTFEYGATAVADAEVGENDVLKVTATLKNTGKKEATEVVQLYVRDLVGSVTRPVRELKGFQRVTLAPGEQTEVVFELPIQDLAFYGKDMVKKIEPGKFQVWIAGDSASGTPVEFDVK